MLNASIGETYSNFWGGMDEEVITKYLNPDLTLCILMDYSFWFDSVNCG